MNNGHAIGMWRQQGYSTISMVMLLMLFGSLMLKGLNGQLTTQIKIYGDERRYLIAYNQALSSVAWSLSQRWALQKNQWQCQISASDGLSACVREIDDGRILIRGSGKLSSSESDLALFQLSIRSDGLSEEGDSHSKLTSIADGAIDFCPLKQPAECSPSATLKAKLNDRGIP